MSGQVYPLAGAQRDAVNPRDSVWLSASAGTGKTQVLSARVLRLLLEKSVQPSDILCLTFTKAGAAEMAVRVNEVLARWVRLPAPQLARELDHLGAPIDPETQARARSLFANVLDCPGGGLRIDTIHAFAQFLLAAFPQEANITPGARAMEDRERDLLSREVLGDLLSEAERAGDKETLGAIAEMSRSKGPDSVRGWLVRCANAAELWSGTGALQPPMRERICRLLGIPSGADEAWAAEACSDEEFPIAALRSVAAINAEWGSKTGLANADVCATWLTLNASERLAGLDGFFGSILTKAGLPSRLSNLEKIDATYPVQIEAVLAGVKAAQERSVLLNLADFLVEQLSIGRKFALLWDEAKQREGLVDFDDQIRRAAELLTNNSLSDWIRYKLDRSFDHILIDEAQDTNEAQWSIIFALTDDFFSGEGARAGTNRTIFTVGDYKQAIFGFQGTSPENFAEAQRKVAGDMHSLAAAARELPGGPDLRGLQDLDLDRSFRTAAPVLEFVDRAIATIGHDAFGLAAKPPEHVGEDRPGLVTMWNLVIDGEGTDDEGEESWLSRHDRKLADKIALQIRDWMQTGFPLVKGRADEPPRRAGPGDIMVLVRKRRELASLIVARLYSHGVPVAGVDRLRLGAPLAVKDLMAALRFAAQPLDDLTLANLLVSPLCGWSQEDLLEHGYRPSKMRLWEHLRSCDSPRVIQTLADLREILRRADFESPQALLHWILTGPIDGRRRLVQRLGSEANDPIDELLNAANAFASGQTASLQGFIRWFDAGDGELKREAGEALDQVRVMTVHGSKGLQAPIVILADAALGPDSPGELTLEEQPIDGTKRRKIPLPALSKDQHVGVIETAYNKAQAADFQEHWRLLYVAMTRAEEALFIAGSLGPRDARRGVAHEDSWYARLLPLFERDALEDSLWGARRTWGALSAQEPQKLGKKEDAKEQLPAWVNRPAPEEPRPPKPLAPSGLGEVEGSDPPLAPDDLGAHSGEAARRGILIHALLERLPEVTEENRESSASLWIKRQAPELSYAQQGEIVASALKVLAEPALAPVFTSQALAEVPLSAIVEGQVVTGIVDRLLVTDEAITVVDFKTARRPPHDLEAIPQTTLKQMAAYVAALEVIYPGRRIEAAVLYTQTPQLFRLPPSMLRPYKSRFADKQESFALPPLE
ncbi:double-strand break repair helicase AddA [Qipengyuania sp. DGS5-3]|uniref:double-strand break repair helicase AddA n=1 Tax=Qipengyuania sp. DGS5-3 TaxID=3349632 RepID=UPI0036D43203